MKFYSLMFCQFIDFEYCNIIRWWLVYIYYINQAGSVYIHRNFSIFFFFLMFIKVYYLLVDMV